VEQSFINLLRGSPGKLQPPIDDIVEYWTVPEKHQAFRMLKHSIVGSPATVRRNLEHHCSRPSCLSGFAAPSAVRLCLTVGWPLILRLRLRYGEA